MYGQTDADGWKSPPHRMSFKMLAEKQTGTGDPIMSNEQQNTALKTGKLRLSLDGFAVAAALALALLVWLGIFKRIPW